jgi:UDP-2,4-diacetamido-2,4,6-trideoxy-beta-L-altropyranose hydrolase
VHVAVRVDASDAVGSGHVMRCLTFAQLARVRGAQVTFICREGAGDLCGVITARGFALQRLPRRSTADAATWHEDAAECAAILNARAGALDLLVVDHYLLDARWESALRPQAKRILVLDDLANRPHDCDVLLDQNLHDTADDRYGALVPPGTRVFVGPRFALLRPEFDAGNPRLRDHGVGRVLVFFGGSDPTLEALKLVAALGKLADAAPFTTIVLGRQHAARDAVLSAASGRQKVEILAQTDEMARLTAEADLGVGTCGGAAWERCLLGLPALVVVTAENQRDDARILDSLGAVRNLGDAADVPMQTWASEIRALVDSPRTLLSMSQAALRVMHGRREAAHAFEAAVFS